MTVLQNRFNSLFKSALLFICVFTAMEFAEYVIAGTMCDYDSLAGMAVVSPLLTFMTFVSIMITSGTITLYSYNVGRADRLTANRYFSQGIILCLFLGILLTVLLIVFDNAILSFWKISGEYLDSARSYYWGIVFRPVVYFLDYLLMGVLMTEGEGKLCVRAALIQAVLTILLGVVLCPFLDVMGLSLASTVAIAVSTAVKASFLRCENCPLEFKPYISWLSVFAVFKRSLFPALQPLMQSLFIIFANEYILNNYGPETLVIYTVVLRVIALGTSISDAVTEAMQPMMCVYMAEDNLAGIKRTMDHCLAQGLRVLFILMAVLLIASPWLPMLFGIREGEFLREAQEAVRLCLLTLPFFLWAHLHIYAYIYTDRSKYALLFLPLLFFFGSAFGVFFLTHRLGETGLWLANAWGAVVTCLAIWLIALFLSCRAKNRCCGALLLYKKRFLSQLVYDFVSTPEEAVAVSQKITDDLTARNIPAKKITKVALLAEEMGLINDNRTAVEVTIEPGQDKVKFIARSNGKHFDASDEGLEPQSFRQFFLAEVMAHLDKESYLQLGEENRIIVIV